MTDARAIAVKQELLWIATEATLAEAAARLAAAPPGVPGLLVREEEDSPPERMLTARDILGAALGRAIRPLLLSSDHGAGSVDVETLDGDQLLRDMAREAAAMLVGEALGSPVACVGGEATASRLVKLLVVRRVELVPVVRGGSVVGAIDSAALLRVLVDSGTGERGARRRTRSRG